MSSPSPQSEFDAAKIVADTLRPFEKLKQEQILRWAAESLGIATHTPQVAAPVFAQAAGHPGGVAAQAGSSPVAGGKDIKTFVESKLPKSDVQFSAVVAYFYRFEAPEAQRKETITPDDLQNAARMANWDRFKRPDLTLSNTTATGYLDRASRGEFRINAVGENLVAMTLPNGGTGPNKKAKRPTGKKTVKKATKKTAKKTGAK